MLEEFRGKSPRVHPSAFVHPGATVIGDVSIGEHSSIWPGAVIRADFGKVTIGKYVSIQDNVVIHPVELYPVKVGDYVIIGHSAVLHGCTIGSNCMVGGGSFIFEGAKVRDMSLVGLGAVVLGGAEVPGRTIVVGIPARKLREITDREIKKIRSEAEKYSKLAESYQKSRSR